MQHGMDIGRPPVTVATPKKPTHNVRLMYFDEMWPRDLGSLNASAYVCRYDIQMVCNVTQIDETW